MNVRFYGILRDYAGRSELKLAGLDGISGEELLEALAERLPGFKKLKKYIDEGEISIVLIVNGRPLKQGERIPSDALVEALPPASGG